MKDRFCVNYSSTIAAYHTLANLDVIEAYVKTLNTTTDSKTCHTIETINFGHYIINICNTFEFRDLVKILQSLTRSEIESFDESIFAGLLAKSYSKASCFSDCIYLYCIWYVSNITCSTLSEDNLSKVASEILEKIIVALYYYLETDISCDDNILGLNIIKKALIKILSEKI